MDEAPLEHLLETGPSPYQAGSLLPAVVRRHRRRRAGRMRALTLACVLALVGTGAGLAISHSSTGTAAGAPAHSRASDLPTSSSGASPSAAPHNGGDEFGPANGAVCAVVTCGGSGVTAMESLGSRRVDGATVSAYVIQVIDHAPVAGGPLSSATTPLSLGMSCVGVRDVVVRVVAGGVASSAIARLDPATTGRGIEAATEVEAAAGSRSQMVVVVVEVEPNVSRVEGAFSSGTRDSAPAAHGWVVLAARPRRAAGAARDGVRLIARSAKGTPVDSLRLVAPQRFSLGASSCPMTPR